MNIRRLWWRIFRPMEVDAVLQCLGVLRPKIVDDAAWGIVIKDAASLVIANPDVVVSEIRLQHRKPTDVASNLLFNKAKAHLISGQYHIYRGVLSHTGVGLSALCRSLINSAIEDGFCTTEEAKETLDYLDAEIKAVG